MPRSPRNLGASKGPLGHMLAWVALDSDTRQLHQDLKGNVFALPYDARAEWRVWAEIHLAEAVAFEFEARDGDASEPATLS